MRKAPRAVPGRLALLAGWGMLALSDAAEAQSARRASSLPGWLLPRQPDANLGQPADSTDLMQAVTADLNNAYDQYLAEKTRIENELNIQFSSPFSVFNQWGTGKGGAEIGETVLSPAAVWTPFTGSATGSGAFTFDFQWNQFLTRANTASQQRGLGVVTAPNDWESNGYQYAQITYTQTLPGDWLAVTAGQYSFALGDSNLYAGNAQTNFISYALAQNGTQAYANAGAGGYALITPNSVLKFAAGLQSATDITGHELSARGFGNGKIAYGLYAGWQPPYLAGGAYSVLWYDQPAVPLQPTASQGVSFNGTQDLNATYGIFVRANNASGRAIPTETSIAFGGIMNDPFGRNRLDQAGIGIDWNKVNQSAVDDKARGAEWNAELYYNYTVFKAMQLTPDVQFYANPALAPNTSFAAVFTLRVTIKSF